MRNFTVVVTPDFVRFYTARLDYTASYNAQKAFKKLPLR